MQQRRSTYDGETCGMCHQLDDRQAAEIKTRAHSAQRAIERGQESLTCAAIPLRRTLKSAK
jgi:nitrate/TMAO reductase-like tetraheme cytochrome c subunit